MKAMMYTVRCSYEGCAARCDIVARGPSVVIDVLLEDGWAFPWGETPDVLSTNGKRHCPQHASASAFDGEWIDEEASWYADCATCGEDYEGSEAACREWEEDHECEPSVAVRKKEKKGHRTQ